MHSTNPERPGDLKESFDVGAVYDENFVSGTVTFLSKQAYRISLLSFYPLENIANLTLTCSVITLSCFSQKHTYDFNDSQQIQYAHKLSFISHMEWLHLAYFKSTLSWQNWPDKDVPIFQRTITPMYESLMALSKRVLSLMAISLKMVSCHKYDFHLMYYFEGNFRW